VLTAIIIDLRNDFWGAVRRLFLGGKDLALGASGVKESVGCLWVIRQELTARVNAVTGEGSGRSIGGNNNYEETVCRGIARTGISQEDNLKRR